MFSLYSQSLRTHSSQSSTWMSLLLELLLFIYFFSLSLCCCDVSKSFWVPAKLANSTAFPPPSPPFPVSFGDWWIWAGIGNDRTILAGLKKKCLQDYSWSWTSYGGALTIWEPEQSSGMSTSCECRHRTQTWTTVFSPSSSTTPVPEVYLMTWLQLLFSHWSLIALLILI